MDANGLRFWQLADRAQWGVAVGSSDVDYDDQRRLLHLASVHAPIDDPGPNASIRAKAETRLSAVAQTSDMFDTRAWLDVPTNEIRATGVAGGEVTIFTCAPGQTVTDVAVGFDGVLYIAVDGAVVLHDLRDRWPRVVLTDEALNAWRLAPCSTGGVWVLDRANAALWRVLGMPFPTRPFAPYSPSTVRPCSENPNPPRLIKQEHATWPSDASPVAIAASPEGRVALMTWATDGLPSVRLLDRLGGFGKPTTLLGARYAYDLAWTDAESVAVLVLALPQESLVYKVVDVDVPDAPAPPTCQPTGDFYPLRDHTGMPFVNGLTYPTQYTAPALQAPPATDVVPLHKISQSTVARRGVAESPTPMDSGSAQTVWHRLYIEACIPPRTAIQLFVAATDQPVAPTDEKDWHEHRIGPLLRTDRGRELPTAAWVPFASELPYHEGLLPCDRVRDRSGLFTVLIQRSNRRVRSLRGRYLWVRAVLHGDGRTSPEIAAVRAYGSRLSYRDRYLPELYRESEVGIEADVPIPATERLESTPADFLERFLHNFEGTFTLLEDRIASAYLLTDPRTVPEDSLEWLAAWVGVAFDPAFPTERRRAMLAAAPQLAREHGTLRGLKHALDVVTGGACCGGEIVVLEDFRLRRTFSTILGIDLSHEEDPLLGGISDSGNSYVGDTLFVGNEQQKEFLALFAESMPHSRAEEAAVDAFFEKLAHRVTILVHQNVDPQDLGLIRRVVELETPAHIQTRVVATTRPLLVGVSSLVGVDTYLTAPIGRQPILVNKSAIGARDFLLRPPSLDPRLGGGSELSHADSIESDVAVIV